MISKHKEMTRQNSSGEKDMIILRTAISSLEELPSTPLLSDRDVISNGPFSEGQREGLLGTGFLDLVAT
jgi:hypothetical protein